MAEEKINKIIIAEYNFYTGNFDFSDDKQKAITCLVFNIKTKHLNRITFLGKCITNNWWIYNGKFCSIYVYTGVEWNYEMGRQDDLYSKFCAWTIIVRVNGKDLGHVH